MYILNNAIKNLLRNKLCNSFSTVVILLMVLAILISSIINSNVNVIKANYEKKFESEVQIKLDAKKIVQSDSGESLIKYSNLSVNDYLNFAKSKYVKKYLLLEISQHTLIIKNIILMMTDKSYMMIWGLKIAGLWDIQKRMKVLSTIIWKR